MNSPGLKTLSKTMKATLLLLYFPRPVFTLMSTLFTRRDNTEQVVRKGVSNEELIKPNECLSII